MRIVLFIILVAIQGVSGFASGIADRPRGYHVDMRLPTEPVPIGSSLYLSVVISNTSDSSLPFDPDFLGFPGGRLRISDERGEEAKAKGIDREVGAGGPQPLGGEELRPGERVMLAYDLAYIFDFERFAPGKVKVEWLVDGTAIAETSVDLVSAEVSDGLELQGAYDPPQLAPFGGNARLSVRVGVASGEHDGQATHWVVVDRIQLQGSGAGAFLPSFPYAVEQNSVVREAMLDFLGQAWVLLENGDRSSLLVWTLHDLKWRTVIPSTACPIEMRSLPARRHTPIENYDIVVAGVRGGPKHSTLSLRSSQGGPAVHVLPVLNATRNPPS